ncbi:MAG TPA: PilZ domain-containing protein [Acidimicrobiales bacterium]|nr:PilZ domain-containing protein [Acidimicrobiales bacterium]
MGQRRAERQPASWRGACVIDGDVEDAGWRECQIIDISMFGVGLTLRHRRPSDLIGRTLRVQIPAGAGCLSASLEGEVRHADAAEPGVARIGMEFGRLSRSEQALAVVLDALTQTHLPEPETNAYETRSRWTTELVRPGHELRPRASA